MAHTESKDRIGCIVLSEQHKRFKRDEKEIMQNIGINNLTEEKNVGVMEKSGAEYEAAFSSALAKGEEPNAFEVGEMNDTQTSEETLSKELEPNTDVSEEIAVAVTADAANGFYGVEKTSEIVDSYNVPLRKKGFRYGCYLFVKRLFDILSSGLVLIVFSWLYLILAILVKCGDGGKVFYRHKRMGKNGKEIHITKFRSMKKNADHLDEMLTPEQLEQYKTEFKIDNDPRITKIGNFLRKTSLDEIPQVWDIFVGRISVVGPRPLIKEEVDEKYGEYGSKLLSVKPGMIGWWAANGRSNCTYISGERQKLELYYVDHCSIWLDIRIIFKTIFSVLKGKGAK